MEKKKMVTRKRVTGIMSALLVVALLLGGTFAFVDFDQHKTNLAKGGENVSVTLNDSYKPPADWKEGQTLNKKVSVTNTAGGSDPIFVRVQFKEYFEMSELELVTDGAGKGLLFATYADGAKKGKFMAWADAQADGYDYVKKTVTYADGSTKDFALTQNAELKNGIYGKKMYIPSAVDVFGNATKANYPTQPHETQSDTNLECNYPVHLWDGNCDIHNDTDTNDIHNYISWDLGDKIMMMDAWITASQPTGDFWVLDTADGWAYWANALQPGAHTSNIMDSITLDNKPGSSFDYYIHIDMQATTVDQLNELKTKGATEGGKNLIDKLKDVPLTLREVIAKTSAGGTFETDGVKWRVLKKDGEDMLIITEYIYGYGTPYNSTEAPAGTKQNTYSQYDQSNLYSWINDWYGENCDSLRQYARMPSHLNSENGSLNYWPGYSVTANLPEARTTMGGKATGTEGVAFTLSVSDVNEYGSNGTKKLNQYAYDVTSTIISDHWWLRTAGPTVGGGNYVMRLIDSNGTLNFSNASSTDLGTRPALWISIGE